MLLAREKTRIRDGWHEPLVAATPINEPLTTLATADAELRGCVREVAFALEPRRDNGKGLAFSADLRQLAARRGAHADQLEAEHLPAERNHSPPVRLGWLAGRIMNGRGKGSRWISSHGKAPARW